jgi:hypothetical protein
MCKIQRVVVNPVLIWLMIDTNRISIVDAREAIMNSDKELHDHHMVSCLLIAIILLMTFAYLKAPQVGGKFSFALTLSCFLLFVGSLLHYYLRHKNKIFIGPKTYCIAGDTSK